MGRLSNDNDNIADSLNYGRFSRQERAVMWLQTAYNAFCRLQNFRDMRRECVDYAYGRQDCRISAICAVSVSIMHTGVSITVSFVSMAGA